jgi:hypothetical protein
MATHRKLTQEEADYRAAEEADDRAAGSVQLACEKAYSFSAA